jgi:hypothetical protein
VHGEEVLTWAYRKGGRPFETNIKNISVEKHFYGKEGEVSADDEITSLEGGYGPLVDELRGHTNVAQVSDPRIADLISHLSVRTKHFRENFRSSIDFLLEEFSEYLEDYGNIRKLVLNHPHLMKETFEKDSRFKQLSKRQKKKVMQQAASMLPQLLESQKAEIQSMFEDFFGEIKTGLPKLVKEGHIKALAKNPAPQTRAKDYADLHWFVVESTQQTILGDTGCLFETSGLRRFKSVDDKGDVIKNVFLPISSTQILIGAALHQVPQIQIGILNEAIAKSSQEYFVSSESSADLSALVDLIGEESAILTKSELEEILRDIINNIDSGSL